MSIELFETIKIENGQIFNIEWHNRRCNKSRRVLFNRKEPLKLEDLIDPPKDGLFRCRIVYTQNIKSIEYIPYEIKKRKTFKIVKSQLSYGYKYNNRTEIEILLDNNYDEIIIEKNNFLTDTSIANIAFYDGESWITPKYPLLHGVTREKLLHQNFLKTKNIKSDDIINFSHFALMNAMIGFQIQKDITIRGSHLIDFI